jgi:hypothetical protein
MSDFEMHLSYIRRCFGHPRTEPARDPEEVATRVIEGDGRSDEAAAAVAYWCDCSEAEAQRFISDLKRKWRESIETSLFKSRQLTLDLAPGVDKGDVDDKD